MLQYEILESITRSMNGMKLNYGCSILYFIIILEGTVGTFHFCSKLGTKPLRPFQVWNGTNFRFSGTNAFGTKQIICIGTFWNASTPGSPFTKYVLHVPVPTKRRCQLTIDNIQTCEIASLQDRLCFTGNPTDE